jgi:RHS repeat-associated protein
MTKMDELVRAARRPSPRKYSYDPYGNRTTVSGTLASDIGYAGYFYHGVSGLEFALYRAYDPTHGRWLNRDPIGEAGGVNLYAYVGGNPTGESDPLGLCPPSDRPSLCDIRKWHDLKVSEKVAALEAEGYLVATNVRMRLVSNTDMQSYAVADYIATIPESNIYQVGEVKTGNGVLTRRQIENYAAGFIQILGNKAVSIGLYQNEIVSGSFIGVDRFPGCPYDVSK